MKSRLLFISVVCIGIAIIFRVFVTDLSFLYKLLKYTNEPQPITDKTELYSKDQLKEYNGIIKKELYLSILGVVYDVSKAEKHYGPGQSYHIFTGKDASTSFITGNFNEGETSDDVLELKPGELLSLKQWKSFYDREYTKKGLLIGRYYDAEGNPTQYFKIVEKVIKTEEKLKLAKDLDEQQYPPCNIEWNAETGTRVWCTDKSGGISRNWIGYPRKYFEPGSGQHRCTCVQDMKEKDPKIEVYEDCGLESDSCYIKL